jgi:hypothetical protein
VIVESKEVASLPANPLFEALTLTICDAFESEFWCETMRPVAETITAEIMKRFQFIPKGQP